MGYDLTNSSDDAHQWKSIGWWYLLNLARHCGWKPAGTAPSDECEDPQSWDGNYFHNDGQVVTAPDASALADSLEQLLSNPAREQVAATVGQRMDDAINDQRITPAASSPDIDNFPLDFVRQMFTRFKQQSVGTWQFDARSDQYLRDFIAFCRKGSFRIE